MNGNNQLATDQIIHPKSSIALNQYFIALIATLIFSICIVSPSYSAEIDIDTGIINRNIVDPSVKQPAKLIQLAARRKFKRRKQKRKASWVLSNALNEPVQLIISLRKQSVSIYRNGAKITTARVSSGRPGYRTPAGIYSILQKRRTHFSNLYDAAPMPFMQRLTWSGIALHAGNVSRGYASHGCIRLPYGFARNLFSYTKVGTHVIVTRDHSEFSRITHANLDSLVAVKRPESEAEKNLVILLDEEKSAKEKFTAASTNLQNEKTNHVKHIKAAATTENDLLKIERLLTKLAIRQNALERQIEASKENAQKYPRVMMRYRAAIASLEKTTSEIAAQEKIFRTLRKASANAASRKRQADTTLEEAKSEFQSAKDRVAALTKDISATREAIRIEKLPLRIFITRPNVVSRVKELQRLLWELGYEPGDMDGYFGSDTAKAIRKFEKDNDLPETGELSSEVMSKLRSKRGKEPLTEAHLYVRQGFKEVFDAPVKLIDADKPLGTHFFTALSFVPGKSTAPWMSLTMQNRGKAKRRTARKKSSRRVDVETVAAIPQTASQALDRVSLSPAAIKWLSARLTPGSSIIIADKGSERETGKGTDFIVQPR